MSGRSPESSAEVGGRSLEPLAPIEFEVTPTIAEMKSELAVWREWFGGLRLLAGDEARRRREEG